MTTRPTPMRPASSIVLWASLVSFGPTSPGWSWLPEQFRAEISSPRSPTIPARRSRAAASASISSTFTCGAADQPPSGNSTVRRPRSATRSRHSSRDRRPKPSVFKPIFMALLFSDAWRGSGRGVLDANGPAAARGGLDRVEDLGPATAVEQRAVGDPLAARDGGQELVDHEAKPLGFPARHAVVGHRQELADPGRGRPVEDRR